VEISPKGFTLGVKAEIEKKLFQSAPSTSKCQTLWPCIMFYHAYIWSVFSNINKDPHHGQWELRVVLSMILRGFAPASVGSSSPDEPPRGHLTSLARLFTHLVKACHFPFEQWKDRGHQITTDWSSRPIMPNYGRVTRVQSYPKLQPEVGTLFW
jgi:hypothetical protein